MPQFGAASEARLATCHPDLQRVLREAIRYYDFTVLCGHRGEQEQEEAYRGGASTKRWPESRHNTLPSEAVDIAPYPINWKNEKEFYYLAGLVTGIATQLGVSVRWGGRWTKPHDCPHIELGE